MSETLHARHEHTQDDDPEPLRPERVSTGIAGLDGVLDGGLPAGRTYLVQGEPGVGKTTLAIQFLLEGVRVGERGIYVALSESAAELADIAVSHDWDLSGIEILELHATEESLKADAQYTFFHPSEIELSETTEMILSAVEASKPKRIVFDSLSEMRLLARDSLRYRRQLLSLKQYFTERGCSVLLLDVHTSQPDAPRDEFKLETLATVFLQAALQRGERCAAFVFDEGPQSWFQRSRALGMPLERHLESGALQVRQVDPAELSPGEFAHLVREAVVDGGVSVVLVDSMNGYRYSMPDEQYLTLHLHELFTFLNQRGVATLVVVAQHGFLGDAVEEPLHISYLADGVVLLRYFEAFGTVRKALSMVKKRTGPHEKAIRELVVEAGRVAVGHELREFQGILAGELSYLGDQAPLMLDRDPGTSP